MVPVFTTCHLRILNTLSVHRNHFSPKKKSKRQKKSKNYNLLFRALASECLGPKATFMFYK